MKRLVFKKNVERANALMGFTGLFICAAFEWNSFIPYLIGMGMLLTAWVLGGLYGRD